jgi:hypothetical protein
MTHFFQVKGVPVCAGRRWSKNDPEKTFGATEKRHLASKLLRTVSSDATMAVQELPQWKDLATYQRRQVMLAVFHLMPVGMRPETTGLLSR